MNQQHVSGFEYRSGEEQVFCSPGLISFLMNSPERFSLQPII